MERMSWLPGANDVALLAAFPIRENQWHVTSSPGTQWRDRAGFSPASPLNMDLLRFSMLPSCIRSNQKKAENTPHVKQ
jgi:hypothetical protein